MQALIYSKAERKNLETYGKYTAHQHRIDVVKLKLFHSVIPITAIFF